MFKSEPVIDDAGKLIEVSAVADDTAAKPMPTAAERAKVWSDYLNSPDPQPAARFMKTGGAAKSASAQPAYKLRQKLADLDLVMRHPHLDRKWRKKVASPRADQSRPVVRGRQGAAKAKAQQDEQ
jgi:hypothetical protein